MIVSPKTSEILELLTSTSGTVNTQMSPEERMLAPTNSEYLDVGKGALAAIRIAQTAARVADFTSILDLPCGHGRVLRWLSAAYPGAKLTACDLIQDGVDFCAKAFGAHPIYSVPSPNVDLFPEQYDLIWVGSLFTHIDVAQWDHFISLFCELLSVNGMLVATTHGDIVARTMRSGVSLGYPEMAVERAIRTYDHAGFVFLEESQDSIDYGISISRPEWVVDRFLRRPEFHACLFAEGLWGNWQDVIAVVKTPTYGG